MKITITELKKLIKKTIKESMQRGGEALYQVEAYDLFEFANEYVSLGGSARDQLEAIINDSDAEVNPHAVDIMKEKLYGFNEEIDNAINAWYETHGQSFESEE